MTSTSPSDNHQQLALELTQNGSDEGQAVTLTTILQRVQSRQKAVEDSQDGHAQEGYSSPPFARSSLLEDAGNLSLAKSSKPVPRACHTRTLHALAVDDGLSSSNCSRTRRKRCYTYAPNNPPVRIVRRKGLYYFRRRIPDALRQIIRRSEIWRSLRTDRLRMAAR